MTAKQPMNEYDLAKKMLNKIREIQATVKPNTYGLIKEQVTNDKESGIRAGVGEPPAPSQEGDKVFPFGNKKMEINRPDLKPESSEEQEDIAVINDVEIVIHSEDPEDLQLEDEEKNNISQLIDEFRTEVSEMVEFDKLHIYEDSAKLDGKITDTNLNFTLSTGDDTGLYISSPSLLKIDDTSLETINKLKAFHPKFANTINNLLVNRRTT